MADRYVTEGKRDTTSSINSTISLTCARVWGEGRRGEGEASVSITCHVSAALVQPTHILTIPAFRAPRCC
jgi:hypothetical protein